MGGTGRTLILKKLLKIIFSYNVFPTSSSIYGVHVQLFKSDVSTTTKASHGLSTDVITALAVVIPLSGVLILLSLCALCYFYRREIRIKYRSSVQSIQQFKHKKLHQFSTTQKDKVFAEKLRQCNDEENAACNDHVPKLPANVCRNKHSKKEDVDADLHKLPSLQPKLLSVESKSPNTLVEKKVVPDLPGDAYYGVSKEEADSDSMQSDVFEQPAEAPPSTQLQQPQASSPTDQRSFSKPVTYKRVISPNTSLQYKRQPPPLPYLDVPPPAVPPPETKPQKVTEHLKDPPPLMQRKSVAAVGPENVPSTPQAPNSGSKNFVLKPTLDPV